MTFEDHEISINVALKSLKIKIDYALLDGFEVFLAFEKDDRYHIPAKMFIQRKSEIK